MTIYPVSYTHLNDHFLTIRKSCQHIFLTFQAVSVHLHPVSYQHLDVYKSQAFNGLMSGLGGAYLVLGQLGMFSENVTSGRGYIALSLVVFGRRNPVGVCLAALFMGAANALQFKMQALGVDMPIQVFTGLPYAVSYTHLDVYKRQV